MVPPLPLMKNFIANLEELEHAKKAMKISQILNDSPPQFRKFKTVFSRDSDLTTSIVRPSAVRPSSKPLINHHKCYERFINIL